MVFASVAVAFALLSLLGLLGIAVSESAFTGLKKRFFCPWKIRQVEVEFIPGFAGLAGKRSGSVYSCTAFEDKYHVTCDRDCEDSEMINKIAAMIQGPIIRYPNP
jgi:hypothetical protein